MKTQELSGYTTSEVVHVRLTEGTKRLLYEKCNKEGRSPSRVIRLLIEGYITGKLSPFITY